MTAASVVPAPAANPEPPFPTDLLGDTVRHEGLAEALNALLAETEQEEDRLPMAVNAFGQWCTKGIDGWRPHRTYMHAYRAAHAEEVA